MWCSASVCVCVCVCVCVTEGCIGRITGSDPTALFGFLGDLLLVIGGDADDQLGG